MKQHQLREPQIAGHPVQRDLRDAKPHVPVMVAKRGTVGVPPRINALMKHTFRLLRTRTTLKEIEIF